MSCQLDAMELPAEAHRKPVITCRGVGSTFFKKFEIFQACRKHTVGHAAMISNKFGSSNLLPRIECAGFCAATCKKRGFW
jgi:hypothetical protein